MRLKSLGICLVAVAVCGIADSVRADNFQYKSFQGMAPPELVSKNEHWVNASGAMSLARLKGSLVWLQFNF